MTARNVFLGGAVGGGGSLVGSDLSRLRDLNRGAGAVETGRGKEFVKKAEQ